MKKLILVLGFLLVFAGTSMAETADGLTPEEETVCDDAGLNGAAWGLCNAYCEAMDCDSDFPKASDEACSKTAEKFSEKTSGDILPCELTTVLDTDGDGITDEVDNCIDVPNTDQADTNANNIGDVCDCPCFTSDEIRATITHSLNMSIYHNGINCSSDPDYLSMQIYITTEQYEGHRIQTSFHIYDALCSVQESLHNPPPPGGFLFNLYFESVSPTVAQVTQCANYISEVCQEINSY